MEDKDDYPLERRRRTNDLLETKLDRIEREYKKMKRTNVLYSIIAAAVTALLFHYIFRG